MQRYFLNDHEEFFESDKHHILNVMRFKTDTEVEICGKNGCFLSRLKIVNQEISYEVTKAIKDNPPLNVTILQGLPKGDKIDFIVKSATLFQAKQIIFMPMKRSIAKLSNTEHKILRLEKISKEAAELSKRSTLPKISYISKLEELDLSLYKVLLLDELEEVNTLNQITIKYPNDNILAIIGPEGGIDNIERNKFINLGALPITLGKTILPTEFAHIPLLNAFSSIKY